MRMVKRLYVTGANGFVGGWIKTMVNTGLLPVDVELVVNNQTYDIRDSLALRAQIRETKPDWVIHLAAQSAVPYSFANPEETLDINLKGTLTLLQALKAEDFKGRLLYVGSADSYGIVPETELPVSEGRNLEPRNPYAVSKAACELLCRQWMITEGLDILLARPFNHIGPGQSTQFSIAALAKQIAAISLGIQAPIVIAGDLDTSRDFLDVRDVIWAYMALLRHGQTGDVYNVCSGQERTIRNMFEQILSIAKVEVKIQYDTKNMRRAEQRRMVGNYAKIAEVTKWQPCIRMNTTLQDIFNHCLRTLQT